MAVRATRVRRTARHQLDARGEVVSVEDFRWVGQRFLDVSAEGALVACDAPVKVGERLVLTFRVPRSRLWFDAEAEVVRIVRGEREGDPGYCAGVRFLEFDRKDRLALGVELREHPLAPRRMRWGAPARTWPLRSTAAKPSVLARKIVAVG